MKQTNKLLCIAVLAVSLFVSCFTVSAVTNNDIIGDNAFPAVEDADSTAYLDEESSMTLSEEIDAIAATIDVGEKDEAYKGDINLYTTYGTLPTLYALLNVYKDIDTAAAENREPAKGYMWFLRGNTANAENLPKNITIMAELSGKQIYDAGYAKKFMAYARKLYATYPNAHFNLYCDDLRAQSEITFFTFNGIPEEQYNVHLLSDGTGSYSFIKDYFYKDSSQEGVEAVEGAKDKWNLYEYWYNEYKNRAKNGNIDTARFLDNNMGACYIMYAASSMENVDYSLQWPELMISDDPEINKYLDTKMHRTKIFPSDIYAQLTESSKNAFLDAILSASNLTRDEYDTKYLPGIKDGKKYMIISGTSPNGEGSSESFEARVNAVVNYYGSKYTYLYKPHPSWPASSVNGREEFLKSKGIVELPAQTPMEVILTAYPEVDLGGYNSSLYMSATGEHVKFFFVDSFDKLSAPLPDLYKAGMYSDAVLVKSDAQIWNPMPFFKTLNGTLYVENAQNIPDGAVIVEAVYNDDGTMKDIKFNKIIDNNPSIENNTGIWDYNTGISLDNLGDNVKIMIWNSLEDMQPVLEPFAVKRAKKYAVLQKVNTDEKTVSVFTEDGKTDIFSLSDDLSESDVQEITEMASNPDASQRIIYFIYDENSKIISYCGKKNMLSENKYEYLNSKLGGTITDDTVIFYNKGAVSEETLRISKANLFENEKYVSYDIDDRKLVFITDGNIRFPENNYQAKGYAVVTGYAVSEDTPDKGTITVAGQDGETRTVKLSSTLSNEKIKEFLEIMNMPNEEYHTIQYWIDEKGELTYFTHPKYEDYIELIHAITEDTIILDANNNFARINLSDINRSASYNIYTFNKGYSDCPFVVIEGLKEFDGPDTSFSVVNKLTENKDSYTISVFDNKTGKIKSLTTDSKNDMYASLKRGDLIAYLTDSNGKVNSVDMIFKIDSVSDFNNFVSKSQDVWAKNYRDTSYALNDYEVFVGPVIDKFSSGEMSIVQYSDLNENNQNAFDIDALEAFGFKYANIIVYDLEKDSIAKGSSSDIRKGVMLKKYMIDHDSYYFDIISADEELDYQIAFAKCNDGDIETLYLITPKGL